MQPGAQFCDICGQPSAGLADGGAIAGPGVEQQSPRLALGPADSPPPPSGPPALASQLPPAGPRQGWQAPPDIHHPPINPDQADDPWASWYGKPRSRQDSPSSTLPRVPPGALPPAPQQDGQGYNGQGYPAGPQYGGPAPGPGYPGPQQYGPGPQYGATEAYSGQQYPGQQYPGQQYPGPQAYPGPGPGGNGAYGNDAFNGGYGGPAGGQYPGPFTDPIPYGDQQYGPGPYEDPGRGGRPGYRGMLRSRGPLIPMLAIGAVAVIAIVALVFASSGGGTPAPAASSSGAGTTVPTPSTSASTAASATAERRAATQLSALVSQSGRYLAAVNAGVSDVEACKALRPARTAFGNSARNRQALLASLGSLPDRSALPPALVADLTSAWQASIQVDRDLHDWAQDEIGGGCDPKKVTSDPHYQASLGYDNPATTSKQKFAQEWQPIAAKYHLPAYQWTQL